MQVKSAHALLPRAKEVGLHLPESIRVGAEEREEVLPYIDLLVHSLYKILPLLSLLLQTKVKEGWSDKSLDARVQSSTLKAHRLILWAERTYGWEWAERIYSHLSRMHFVEQGVLNADELLLEAVSLAVGEEGGTELLASRVEEARDVLKSNDYEREVFRKVEEVESMGIHRYSCV